MTKISLMLSLIAVAGLAHADLRSEILAARKKQEKAAMAKDVKAAEAAAREAITSDFKYIQGGQTQDAKTFIDNYTAGFSMLEKITSSSSRIIALKQTGNTATGTLELKMTGIMKGQGKKTHSMDYTGIFNDQFRKVGGKWKTSVMAAGPQKFLIDGKPVKM